MRPIERRPAAVEARTMNTATIGYRLFVLPRDMEEAAFRARCEAEGPGKACCFIRFVQPGEASTTVLH